MTSLLLLYIIATLDGACCAYRTSAGRNALIDKRAYYRHAMLHGVILVQATTMIAAVTMFLMITFAPGREALLTDMLAAAARMLRVFLPFSLIALVAACVRIFPSVDFRSATSVFIFGPITALRPLMALAGVLYSLVPAQRVETRLLAIIVLAMMFAVQMLLDGWAAREHRRSFTLNHTLPRPDSGRK